MTPIQPPGTDIAKAYAAARDQIVRLIRDGVRDADRVLPLGASSFGGAEALARAYCAATPQSDLAMLLPILTVGVSIAAQGAYRMELPVPGGQLVVPVVQQFVGTAPSGNDKSTTLRVMSKPVEHAMTQAARSRSASVHDHILAATDDAQAAVQERGGDWAKESKQLGEVFGAGHCAFYKTSDPTPEALKAFIAAQGGVGVIEADEPDVFRNLRAYTDDGGSLTPMLIGWDQGNLATYRVSTGSTVMDEVVVPMAVLLQGEVFTDMTGGTGRGGDSFIERGMFSRIWVADAHIPPPPGGGEFPGEDAYVGSEDPDRDEHGQLTPLGKARQNYAGAVEFIAQAASEYRMRKAQRFAWLAAQATYGERLLVRKPPPAEKPIVLSLDRAALREFLRVQWLRDEVIAAVDKLAEAEPSVRGLWHPLAKRLTQHVMRDAAIMAMSHGEHDAVSAEWIRDAATRLVPWRWALSVECLGRRAAEAGDVTIETALTGNPTMDDRSPTSLIVKALQTLTEGSRTQPGERYRTEWTASLVKQKAKNSIPSAKRKGIGPAIEQALAAAVASGAVIHQRKESTTNPFHVDCYHLPGVAPIGPHAGAGILDK